MELSDNARFVEIVLFLENEPLSAERFMKMTGLSHKEVLEALGELSEHYFSEKHGMVLVQSAETWQFIPANDMHEKLRYCYGRKVDKRLSNAARETLSIIAYSQPITRREIDNIRGVVSDTILRILREREYIKVVGRKDVSGHPCLYGTTKKFLYEFGLPSISALPKLNEVDRQRFEEQEIHEKEEGEDD
ncbi:MAG: SMC-Scp complex subunit ScpB [Sphaerochaetaceae bacterium]|jgi:segregation and condensation protein B